MLKKVLLLGASGSIGTSTLDILDKHSDKFELVGIVLGNRNEIIEPLLNKYPSIKHVYLFDENKSIELANKYENVIFYNHKFDICDVVTTCDFDICVNALVGFAGLEPSIRVLQKDKILCLANKESLVAGGNIINELLANGHGKLYPIDSEHVALARCLSKVNPEDVEQLVITASGGALRNVSLDKLNECRAEDALKHPNWSMGKKITIDCATMINKGFEIIEAHYLFGYGLDKIRVQMHDESLVHSAVLLKDGSYVIDYGKPDMHSMIEYALLEGRQDFEVRHISSLDELNDCHFREYDPIRYPLCELAKECLESAPSKMVALNGANEVAVNRYLDGNIKYLEVAEIVQRAVAKAEVIQNPTLLDIKRVDYMARLEASK